MDFKEKEVLNSFVHSNFNYCPLVWQFYSSKSLYKIEKIQERAFRLVHNDFASDYAELLKKSGKATMEAKYLPCLPLEIFKTVTNLHPYYMKEFFSKTTNLTYRHLDISLNRIILQNMEVIASGVQDPTFGILSLAKSKRKRIIKNLRTIKTTGFV